MGSGQSSSEPNLARIVITSTDMNDHPTSIEPETHIPEEIASSLIIESSDSTQTDPVIVTAAFNVLNLSNEVNPSSALDEELQSPSIEETIATEHLLLAQLRTHAHARVVTDGTLVIEDVDIYGRSDLPDESYLVGLENENDHVLDGQDINILGKPDIDYIPSYEHTVERPNCTSESDIKLDTNSGVSPVSSSSVSFAIKVDTTSPSEAALNSEYNIESSIQKPIVSDRAIASSNTNLNAAVDINARLDTRVEVKVYPCSNSAGSGANKKFTQFTIKPEVR